MFTLYRQNNATGCCRFTIWPAGVALLKEKPPHTLISISFSWFSYYIIIHLI